LTDLRKKVKVAVAMPVFNRRQVTLQGLRSLFRVDQEGIDLRMYVTDDGSTDGTGAAIRGEFPEVKLINGDGRLHYAGGINRAVASALKWNPDFILVANDDAVFHSRSISNLIKTAAENGRSIVGSLLLLWNEPHRVFQVDPEWRTSEGGWIFPDNITLENVHKGPFEVDALVGNCVLIPAAAFVQCGLMDERRFPFGWGDAQYFERLRKSGWKLLVDPSALVWCEPNTNPIPLHTKEISSILRALFFDKRHPVNLQRQFIARWYSAPSKPKAVTAFLFYLLVMSKRAIRH
jgi:Predicted glycosyltransferases